MGADVTFYYQVSEGEPMIYVAGGFNGWNGADPASRLTDTDHDGIYTVTVSLYDGPLSYKFVKDGTWTQDPWNPETDGGEYQNSQLTVQDPMITYLLPVRGGVYTSADVPDITVIIAASTPVAADSFALTLNGTAVPPESCTYDGTSQTLTYAPGISGLLAGANVCGVTLRAGGTTVSRTTTFQYAPESWVVVSGAVTLNGEPLPGLTVGYAVPAADSVRTNSRGKYAIAVAQNVDVTVTPRSDTYTFAPSRITIDKIAGNQPDQDFTAGTGSSDYTVSGYVTDAAGTGMENVMVNFGMGDVKTRYDGFFTLTLAAHTALTLTPALPPYTFTPSSITIADLSADMPGRNFIGIEPGGSLDTFTVSGTVSRCGNGLSGVAITYGGDTVRTDTAGAYAVGVVGSGVASLVPVLDGYTFSPAKREFYNLAADTAGVDFDAVPETDTITGRIVFAGTDTGCAGVTVHAEGPRGPLGDLLTDARGSFALPVTSETEPGMYRLTPARDGLVFDPAELQISTDDNCSFRDNSISAAPPAPSLCMVGTDDSGHNMIVWQRAASDYIATYGVYRETNQAGVFGQIGSVPYDSNGIFVDTLSDPAVKAYTYGLTAVTVHGYETSRGATHKTIHLTINQGVGSSWNLIWSHYEGRTFSSYNLYRGTDPDSMTLVTDIASNLASYTDLNPPTGRIYYQIEALLPGGCNPDTLIAAKAAVTYLAARSNIADTDALGVADAPALFGPEWPSILNPVTDRLPLSSPGRCRVVDVAGRTVLEGMMPESGGRLDVTGLVPGIYVLQTDGPRGIRSYRFLKR